MSPIIYGGSSGGGSVPVTESGFYVQSGAATTILANGNAFLPFDEYAGGDDVLDISVPGQPTVKKAGLFVVSVEVVASPTSTGLYFALYLDYTGSSITMGGGPVSVSNSWKLTAGQAIRLRAFNDAGETRDFNIQNATVSRIGPA